MHVVATRTMLRAHRAAVKWRALAVLASEEAEEGGGEEEAEEAEEAAGLLVAGVAAEEEMVWANISPPI